jgi:hypothetical protein
VVSEFLVVIIGACWIAVYTFAVFTQATQLGAASVILLVVLGVPLVVTGLRYSLIAAKLAADQLESQLGFRPKWWMCYSAPQGWANAIERQKRWHKSGKWPLVPW